MQFVRRYFAGATLFQVTHYRNELVGEAVANCAQKGYAVTAAVVDLDGVRQAILRGNGAPVIEDHTHCGARRSVISSGITSTRSAANTRGRNRKGGAGLDLLLEYFGDHGEC